MQLNTDIINLFLETKGHHARTARRYKQSQEPDAASSIISAGLASTGIRSEKVKRHHSDPIKCGCQSEPQDEQSRASVAATNYPFAPEGRGSQTCWKNWDI